MNSILFKQLKPLLFLLFAAVIAVSCKKAENSEEPIPSPASGSPTFTAMSPNSGKTGDIITLSGTGFNSQLSENKVFFATKTGGTVVLATIKTASATQLTVEVPANVITGSVLIVVDGTNATPAKDFNTTFTAINTSGTGNTSVSYVDTKSGALNFSLLATASKEIGPMILDRVKNTIYYSDYTISNLVEGQNTVYKISIEGSSTPLALTADARITKIVKIATDPSGNVYVLKSEDGSSSYSIYKINIGDGAVTEVIKNFNIRGSYGSVHFFYINSNNEICIRPGFKISAAGAIINTETPIYGLQQKDGGALVNGGLAYLLYNPDNTITANKMNFMKWDLAAGTIAEAGFKLGNVFSADDPDSFDATNKNLRYVKYVVDGNDNMYAIMDHSYISGSISNTWMVRKYNLKSNTSTSLGSFLIKFPSLDLQGNNSNVEFVGDARGNLFLKANGKDIIKITQ